MNIINNVTHEAYIQWIEDFVLTVFKTADVKCTEVIIADIENSKRVFITADGQEYIIRTWNYQVVELDKKGIPCAEYVDYTLYKMVSDKSGSYAEEIDEGFTKISWVNN